jgi:hypothetical protein
MHEVNPETGNNSRAENQGHQHFLHSNDAAHFRMVTAVRYQSKQTGFMELL